MDTVMLGILGDSFNLYRYRKYRNHTMVLASTATFNGQVQFDDSQIFRLTVLLSDIFEEDE